MIQWDGAAEDTTKLTSGTIAMARMSARFLSITLPSRIEVVMDTIHGEWLHIHEELHGCSQGFMPCRTPDSPRSLTRRGSPASTSPLPLAPGGSLSRALKLVSMQLHRVEFKVTYNAFTELLVGNTAVGGDYDDVYVRNSEDVSASTMNRLTGAVRAADGNDFATDPTANGLLTAARGAFTMDLPSSSTRRPVPSTSTCRRPLCSSPRSALASEHPRPQLRFPSTCKIRKFIVCSF